MVVNTGEAALAAGRLAGAAAFHLLAADLREFSLREPPPSSCAHSDLAFTIGRHKRAQLCDAVSG